MKSICVFCGSSPGSITDYVEAARLLGTTLANRNIKLVYGGAKVGLMGQLAKSCIESGGKVIGIIPKHLADKEVAFEGISELMVVNSMHERKSKMAELSDGFIALPGGMGTLEELCEILTWAQLDLHQKPCGILNINGYYDRLMQFIDHSVEQKFMEQEHRDMIQIDQNPGSLLDKFEVYQPPVVNKAKWALKLTEDVI
jgi:uncharacterized protein (TIGR00730 family)